MRSPDSFEDDEFFAQIKEIAKSDYALANPFAAGSLFENTIDAQKRHAYGIHFTSEADIMKVVKPTISDYWEEKIEGANTVAELNSLQVKLQNYKVLDPACGSGNFLYVAYQELKEIEKLLLNKIRDRHNSKTLQGQGQISLVTPLQFYGIDINPFAVELAKVTLTIAKKVAIDRLKLTEKELPLDALDKNIICDDALFTDWIKADAIIGNPPFLGGKKLRQEFGDRYAEKVYKQFPKIKDVDYCSYWFLLAHEQALGNKDNITRVGLVGTNSISQGKTRKVTLDYITKNQGYIHNATSTQPWPGEAKVHASIVNWCLEEPKQYFLDNEKVDIINSSLQPHINVATAKTIKANCNKSFQGIKPVGKGFIIDKKLALSWIENNDINKQVVKCYSDANSLTKNVQCHPKRWIVDFNNMELEDVFAYTLPLAHIKTTVKPIREKSKDQKLKNFWWRFERTRPEMRKEIINLSSYFIVPRHSKWFIFLPNNNNCLPADSTTVVASDDYYILGILTSNIHRSWIEAQSSTLKGDTRYTPTTCFETFPFPQNCSQKIVQQVRNKTTELHEYRTQQMGKKQWGITQLYNEYFHEPASKLCQLHQQLDELAIKAYGFKVDEDILSKLLELNLQLADKEQRGEKIVGPKIIDK